MSIMDDEDVDAFIRRVIATKPTEDQRKRAEELRAVSGGIHLVLKETSDPAGHVTIAIMILAKVIEEMHAAGMFKDGTTLEYEIERVQKALAGGIMTLRLDRENKDAKKEGTMQ